MKSKIPLIIIISILVIASIVAYFFKSNPPSPQLEMRIKNTTTCQQVCANLQYDTGRCKNPKESTTTHLYLGPCLDLNTKNCYEPNQCNCYCYNKNLPQ